MSSDPEKKEPRLLRSPRRLLLALAGVVCVGIAWAGVFVPGLPTTIFLIAASYLFVRSCPVLEERLIRNRFFRPYLRYAYGDGTMPVRAKIVAISLMWIGVSVSLALLSARGQLPLWLALLLTAAAASGTVVILRIRARFPDRIDPANTGRCSPSDASPCGADGSPQPDETVRPARHPSR